MTTYQKNMRVEPTPEMLYVSPYHSMSHNGQHTCDVINQSPSQTFRDSLIILP
jgi:hypothetical protein